MSLMELLEEWQYTFARLDAYEWTRPLAVELAPLEGGWHGTLQREIALLRPRAVARARVANMDGELDQFVDIFNNQLKTIVGNDQSSELYRRFFSPRRPSELKRPMLDTQLVTMAGWITTLESLEPQALKAQAEALRPLVQRARDAEAALALAEQELDDFYALKEHKDLVDRLNAARNLVHGKLKELRHARADLHLPADWAEQFFLREERSRGPTLVSERKTIERLEKQLERHREILGRLEGEAEAEAQEVAARAEVEKELEEMEKQRRQLAEREAELRKKLGR
jgi:predicted ribosome quality control (RQC) complex YloA/Tae2 family protein